MDRKTLLSKVDNITIWKKGDQRAPHKPLLMLYALGQLQQSDTNTFKYNDVYEPLRQLLIEYGPKRKTHYPEQPFVRLSNDGIWLLNRQVQRPELKQKWMRENNIVGSFTDDVVYLLRTEEDLIFDMANLILYSHFPESLHEQILDSVGLVFNEPGIEVKKGKRRFKPRDPKFRGKIMEAYNGACCICGYDVKINSKPVGIEAAHIKWHQAGGPDIEQNGLALCTLHHILFDRGAFTLDSSHKIETSNFVDSSYAADKWLYDYSGRSLRKPVSTSYLPSDQFLEWHNKEVYRG